MLAKSCNRPERTPYRAILSVSDKTEIYNFSKDLIQMGWEVVGTKGTCDFLKERGLQAKVVDDLLGYSQCLGHRVKTLDLKVLGGLLWNKYNDQHNIDAARLGFIHFDLIVSSFYPFDQVKQDSSYSDEEIIEYIDVGGPTMLRSAAKNFNSVIPIVEKEDYMPVVNALKSTNGNPNGISSDFRKKLAFKAFRSLHEYDSSIVSYFEHQIR